MPYKLVKPVIYMHVRNLCRLPYYNHPKGCPNYNHKAGCPPDTLPISKILNLNGKIYVIWNVFSFGRHCRRMRRLHSQWSKYQIKCCLWWQGKARKDLQKEIDGFRRRHPGCTILYPPEAYGVNVTETMKRIGIELEWPPKIYAYQVAIAGRKGKHNERIIQKTSSNKLGSDKRTIFSR